MSGTRKGHKKHRSLALAAYVRRSELSTGATHVQLSLGEESFSVAWLYTTLSELQM